MVVSHFLPLAPLQTESSSTDKDSDSSRNINDLSEKIADAEANTDINPTEAQKEAGNYKKGHVRVGTFDISIEQPKGSVRSGVDANGKKSFRFAEELCHSAIQYRQCLSSCR